MKNSFIGFDNTQRQRFIQKLIKVSDDYAGVILKKSYIPKTMIKSTEGFTHFLNYKEEKKGIVSRLVSSRTAPKKHKTKRRRLIEGYNRLDTLSNYHMDVAAQALLKNKATDGADLAYSFLYLYYNYYFDFENSYLKIEGRKREPELNYGYWSVSPPTMLFLSIIFGKVSDKEPIVNFINRVEESGAINKGVSEDMPYYQFSRWLMLYTLTKEKPDYTIKSALFSSIVENWTDDELFLQTIINILDHHLAECMDIREVELEHTRYYRDGKNYTFRALWEENHVIPLEILALRQLRLNLGLYWPEEIDHPLMFDDLYEMVDKAKAQIDTITNELLETIQKVIKSDDIPTKAEIVHAINTVPLYEPPEDDW